MQTSIEYNYLVEEYNDSLKSSSYKTYQDILEECLQEYKRRKGLGVKVMIPPTQYKG